MLSQIFTLVSCYVIFHCMGSGLFQLFQYKKSLASKSTEILWLLTIAVCLIAYMMSFHRLYPNFPRMHIFRATWVLLPPVMYFYFKSLSGENPIKSSWQLLHFLPFVVKAILLTPFFLAPLINNDEILARIPSSIVELFFYRTVEGRLASSIHFLIYLGLSYHVLKTYRVEWTNLLSVEQSMRLNWLRSVNILTIGSYSIYSSLLIYQWISGEPGLLNGLPSPGVAIFLSFVFFNFAGLNLISRAIDDFPKLDKPSDDRILEPSEGSIKEAIEETTHNHSELLVLKTRLEHYMHEHKPYLSPQLNINKLAELLVVSPRKLSKLFNQLMNTNFYDYINRYRVAEVEALFRKADDVELLDIAFQAGFQSKSAFNKNFLKHTGKTPTAYLKQLANNNEVLSS